MSFEVMRRQSSTFLAAVLNGPMSAQRSLRALMTCSPCAAKAAFSKMSREPAEEVSSISTWLRLLVDVVGREGDVAVR